MANTQDQGFAKQNYTMLDNLKLGYGGTKTEMRRLIKEAAALDESVDASSMSFDNIVRAIHAVQKEMGITGTTATEAATTITGSVNMAKAAWQNLLVSMGSGNNDLERRFDEFEKAAATAVKNILPKLKDILISGVDLIGMIVPIVIEQLPDLVDALAEPMAKAIAEIISAALVNFDDVAKAIINFAGRLVTELVFAVLEKLGLNLDGARRFLYGDTSSMDPAKENAISPSGSHRLGLARVPYDGYIAELHEGERVLTKTEAERYRGEKRGDVTVNVNIDGARYNDVESLAEAVAQRLERLFEDEDAVVA